LHEYSFEKYVDEYYKSYASSAEYNLRKSIFEEKLSEIVKHNKENHSWKKGINHLSDLTHEEFKKLLGYKRGAKPEVSFEIPLDSKLLSLRAPPSEVDWRSQGVISAVKDQGMCGSCWTFGSTETLESYWAMATNGRLMDLSEQQVLDCVPNPNDCGGTGGCGGGTAELAYAQLVKMGGIASEWTYPYQSYFAAAFQCRYNATLTKPMAKLLGYTVLASNQYLPVMQALTNIGPLVVNVDASVWFSYETGVFNGCNQTNPDIDHVVQLVGYGTDPKLGDYWLVRNSWSPNWGEDGYIRLRRSQDPPCGVDLKPQDGTGCNNGPPSVPVCGTCGILYDVSFPIVKTN